ncbi:MAG: hypothetical protein AB1640_12810 [bacterium]
MLTRGDDYPIHQRAEPIATAGGDLNFYDRYFFNGYAREGRAFFAVALGVYPHRNVVDASFCVIHEGVQHNLRASRHLGAERMDTRAGPVSIEVLEPLRSLRVAVGDNPHGIRAEVVFTARAPALEEPRFRRELGRNAVMDYTRLTQNGCYHGFISVGRSRIDITPDWVGTRDRSWGVRPLGSLQNLSEPGTIPQFYWLWAPVNFDDCVTLYDLNDDAGGTAWHTHGVMVRLPDGEPEAMRAVSSRVQYRSGTRHARSAEIFFVRPSGRELRLLFEPLYHFYMSGLGYTHPEWGHGVDRGEMVVGYDTIDLATVDESIPLYLHIQAVSRVEMNGRRGMGVLEQLVLGPHAPSGFNGLLDPAP